MKVNIAIDGPSASGKSTIAKALAQRLGYTHIDTGSMYRASAYMFKQKNLDLNNIETLVHCIKTSDFSFNDQGEIMIDGQNVHAYIRTKDIDILTSSIAKIPEVRAELVKLQQAMVKNKGYVMDGRDIGSVVMPEAEVKIFQTASIDSRAQRRYNQYQILGSKVSYQQIYDEIQKRDTNDTLRASSPLKKMEDAYELDTSQLSIEESVDLAYDFVMKRIQELSHD